MITAKNHRLHRRIPYMGPMRISWEDQDQPCFATARSIDLSEGGMRVELMQQVPRGARILIAAERLKLSASALVQRVERNSGRYLLGVRFTQAIPAGKIDALEGRQAVTFL
jgi:PilZ domain